MTKEITPAQAMQYLEMLVALDNTQIAKDTLEYFKQLEEENAALRSDNLNVKDLLEEIAKQNKMLDMLKPFVNVDFEENCPEQYRLYLCGDNETEITKEQYDILKEWKNESKNQR